MRQSYHWSYCALYGDNLVHGVRKFDVDAPVLSATFSDACSYHAEPFDFDPGVFGLLLLAITERDVVPDKPSLDASDALRDALSVDASISLRQPRETSNRIERALSKLADDKTHLGWMNTIFGLRESNLLCRYQIIMHDNKPRFSFAFNLNATSEQLEVQRLIRVLNRIISLVVEIERGICATKAAIPK